jgi:hypothetical protein
VGIDLNLVFVLFTTIDLSKFGKFLVAVGDIIGDLSPSSNSIRAMSGTAQAL